MTPDLWLILLLAVALDRIFGEPPRKAHPTVWMGIIIDFFKERAFEEKRKDFLYGFFIFSLVTFTFATAAFVILSNLGSISTILIGAFILKVTFSWKDMAGHARPVKNAVDKGDLEAARISLSKIVGRDTRGLDKNHIISATVESIGEGSVDGVASPIFYYLVIGSVFGVPAGIAAAVFFRATSTLDSMIGYKRYGVKGYTAAKMDDILNYLPSRIMGVVIIASSFILGENWKNAIEVFENDRGETPSPNSGHTMAALAGALGVGLEKEGVYSLGGRVEKLETCHISKAIYVVDFSIMIFIVFTLVAVLGVPV